MVEAKNGNEALVQLEQQRFDMMFCDLNMPELTGDDLIERLMLEGKYPYHPSSLFPRKPAPSVLIDCNASASSVSFASLLVPKKLSLLFRQAEQLLQDELVS